MRPIARIIIAVTAATVALRAGDLSASADQGPHATFPSQQDTVRCFATA